MSETVSKLLLTPDGAPRDRIVGFESEYGFGYISPDGTYSGNDAHVILSRLPRGSQQYLETGERLYEDHSHPELSGAEHINFLDASHWLLNGHLRVKQYLLNVAKDLIEAGSIDAAGAVDLVANTRSPNGRSWGRHENQLVPRSLEYDDFVPALAAHRASRIVWSGAGAVVDTTNGEYRFQLSEKADFIECLITETTIEKRGLINTRDEPHADPGRYRRIHNITGESVMSPFANALALASESIVLRACELGVKFDDLMPAKPVRAMQKISHDPSLQRTIRLVTGRKVTGVQLQREIMERSVKAALAANYLTEQEQFWAGQWAMILDRLEVDPQKCGKFVDWVIKQKLITRELDGRQQLHDLDTRPLEESPKFIAWNKAVDYHRLLPEEGPGMKLLRRGGFAFSPTTEQLTEDLPVPETRAKLRGDALRLMRQHKIMVACNWLQLKNERTGRSIVIRDPFATSDPRIPALLKRTW